MINQVWSLLDSRKPLSSLFTFDEETNRESFHAFARYLYHNDIEMNDALWSLAAESNQKNSHLSFGSFKHLASNQTVNNKPAMP